VTESEHAHCSMLLGVQRKGLLKPSNNADQFLKLPCVLDNTCSNFIGNNRAVPKLIAPLELEDQLEQVEGFNLSFAHQFHLLH
jgi:hypothetical protein